MSQTRIKDGLERLVQHYLADKDDPAFEQTLEVCKRLLERYLPVDKRIEIDVGREDDDVENVRDVGHINELIKRRCTSTKTEKWSVDCSNTRGIFS